jgi:hypothetical protein
MDTPPLLTAATSYADLLHDIDAYAEARATAEACRALARVSTDPAERNNLTQRAGWHAMRADALYLNLLAHLDTTPRRTTRQSSPTGEA